MLAEAAGVKKIIIACGRTDLEKGLMVWRRSSEQSMI